ncbi:MAG: hypothetical protein ACK4KT_06280 [Thermaurantimonas sp.]
MSFIFYLAHGHAQNTHTIEVNFDFNFTQNTVKIQYLISPPDSKEFFEYDFRPYNIQDFRLFVLKPRESASYTSKDGRLGIQHSGNIHHKYQFYCEVALDQLITDQLLIFTSRGYELKYSEENSDKLFPKPVKGNPQHRMSVCSDLKMSPSGKSFVLFTDSKRQRDCIFKDGLTMQDLRSIVISFSRPAAIASAAPADRTKPPSGENIEKSKAEKPIDYRKLFTENPPCKVRTPLAYQNNCRVDSAVVPTDFYPPFNTYYYLTARSLDPDLFCIKSALILCEGQNWDILEFLNAYELVIELLKDNNKQIAQLTLRNVVDNHTKNSGYINATRLYYTGLIYNLYFHNGPNAIKKLVQTYVSQYGEKNVFDAIRDLNLFTEFEKPQLPIRTQTPLSIRYELNYHASSGGYRIHFADSAGVLKPGTKLTWIIYLKNQKIDTVTTATTGSQHTIFDISSDSEILFIYPQWEENLMIPTIEKRPDYQAILELNYGYTPLNRYRAFRTMISTGNPNLLATAVSLVLDDSLPQIQSIGYERLDEVPEYQVQKVKDGLLRSLAVSDAFTRPTAYRNAERLHLKVQRPVISNQSKSNLYADLQVLKQFEGLKAIDLAIESFIEGNSDEGLIWFLAENAETEVIDLMLTFEYGSDLRDVLKRILVVSQAYALASHARRGANLPDADELSRRLRSAGYGEEIIKFILANLEVSIQLFKASFTNR